MDSSEAHKWSRHYDTMLWTVSAILAAANGALLAYAYGAEKLTVGPPILGVVLTLSSVFFASSFRVLRRRLNQYLKSHESDAQDDVRFLLSHLLFKQWPVYLVLHVAILWAWAFILKENQLASTCLWWAVGGVGILFVFAWGIMADRLPLGPPPGK